MFRWCLDEQKSSVFVHFICLYFARYFREENKFADDGGKALHEGGIGCLP